jgi:ssDNA-binding Zn-finger/Zn-ribbon topoisomerase 1
MELKLCPRCGSDDILVERLTDRQLYRVQCLQCQLSVEQEYAQEQAGGELLRGLLSRWNQLQTANRPGDRTVKNCPFCGSDILLIERVVTGGGRVGCPECNAFLPSDRGVTELLDLWGCRRRGEPGLLD